MRQAPVLQLLVPDSRLTHAVAQAGVFDGGDTGLDRRALGVVERVGLDRVVDRFGVGGFRSDPAVDEADVEHDGCARGGIEPAVESIQDLGAMEGEFVSPGGRSCGHSQDSAGNADHLGGVGDALADHFRPDERGGVFGNFAGDVECPELVVYQPSQINGAAAAHFTNRPRRHGRQERSIHRSSAQFQ